jgi:hypothetical protein
MRTLLAAARLFRRYCSALGSLLSELRSAGIPAQPDCACDQHAPCGLAGIWFPLAINKGRGAWLAAAAGESGSRGAARRGHISYAPLPLLPGGQQEMLTGYPPGC